MCRNADTYTSTRYKVLETYKWDRFQKHRLFLTNIKGDRTCYGEHAYAEGFEAYHTPLFFVHVQGSFKIVWHYTSIR